MAAAVLGVWQMHPAARDIKANLARLAAVAHCAAGSGITHLVTPELALTGYDIGDIAPDDPALAPAVLRQLEQISADAAVHLIVGAALSDGAGVYNCSVMVDVTRGVVATHRKAHLFGDLDRGRFTAGETPFELARLGDLRVATMVCYDVEFPEGPRAAALAGADLLAVPTANMAPYEAVCTMVVPTRALENQMFVAYANHFGREGDTQYVGRSVIAGPQGVMAMAGADGEELLRAELDTAHLAASRSANPYLTDRRPTLYEGILQRSREPGDTNEAEARSHD